MASVSTQAPKIQKYIRGDSRQLNIQFFQSDGVTPFDLTGCEVFFTLNSSQTPTDDTSDTGASLKKSTTSFTNPASGLATITLTNLDTQPLAPNTYYYDIQLKDSSGNVTSLQSNTFEVVADITTRIA
jgi:hypothetical protein